MRFSIRDLLWLTLVVASLTAWWHTKRENAALRVDNVAKFEALKAKSQAIELSAKKEKSLRHEVDLLGQLVRSGEAELRKRDAELRDSLERRKATLNALQTLKDAPATSN